MAVKMCIISDTHAKWQKLQIPECDILISCGDFSFVGEKHLVKQYHEWLSGHSAKHIISIPGNHEIFEEGRRREREMSFIEAKALVASINPKIHFLEEGRLEIEGIKIWCSAWNPWFYNWGYNARQQDLKRHWELIPDDTELLITHCPPLGILDSVMRSDGTEENTGCRELRKRIAELKMLRMHCFGHIHEQYGTLEKDGVVFINAAICNDAYQPVNLPQGYLYEKYNQL